MGQKAHGFYPAGELSGDDPVSPNLFAKNKTNRESKRSRGGIEGERGEEEGYVIMYMSDVCFGCPDVVPIVFPR